MGPQLEWDYTSLAPHYDKRANYSSEAIENLLRATRTDRLKTIADIGAGTGKLTIELLRHGLNVIALEPNDTMRSVGVRNTQGRYVLWQRGTGEETGLKTASAYLAVFGSSFNVTDRARALKEVHRILVAGGWFACLWNYRDLSDPLQAQIEAVIKGFLPNYDHGTRRQDQSLVIDESGLFSDVQQIQKPLIHQTTAADYVEAWKSHATLQRQAGKLFPTIIRAIAEEVKAFESLRVRYLTHIWFAQRISVA